MFALVQNSQPVQLIKADQSIVLAEVTYSHADLAGLPANQRTALGIYPADYDRAPAPDYWLSDADLRTGTLTFDGSSVTVVRNWQPPRADTIDWTAADLANLNAAMTQPGSVVRALALVLLQEINTLRTKAGLATYTQAQLVNALQAKMR